MNVELLLNVGSPEGTIAPIQQGYYLIGRSRECQIRPKSKSVSRRHCLVFHNDDGVGVMDLESAGGTKINGLRIKPKTWHILRHGDEVRCGKVTLGVRIAMEAALETAKSNASQTKQNSGLASVDEDEKGSGSSLRAHSSRRMALAGARSNDLSSRDDHTPESWDNLDLSDYLDDDDDGDSSDDLLQTGQDRGDSDDDLSVFVDTPLESVEANTDVDLDVNSSVEVTGGEAPSDWKDDSPPAKKTKKKKSKDLKPKKPLKIPKAKRPKGPSRLPSFSFSGLGEGTEKWKVIGAFVLAVSLLGFFGYQLTHFVSGPDVRVLEELDY